MKTIRSLIVATVVLASGAALAADRPEGTSAAPSKKASEAGKPQKTLVTGSYIKQKVRRNGAITSGMNNVVVLDSETIQNSGASDLAQLLVRKGVIR